MDDLLRLAAATSVSSAHYHVERARAELDMGYRADDRAAAEAHLRLSALHMERARSAAAVRQDPAERRPDSVRAAFRPAGG